MTLEGGLWRAEGSTLTRLSPSGIPLESQLEDYIESDPMLLGERLLLIGRQVPTPYGGFIDLLAVDGDGIVHVIELKRDKTPRDVVAQTLDYGSWVADLDRSEVIGIFEIYQPSVAFDAATERIVRFLNESFNVPVNLGLSSGGVLRGGSRRRKCS